MVLFELEKAVKLMTMARYREAMEVFDRILDDLKTYFHSREAKCEADKLKPVQESSEASTVVPFLGPICVAHVDPSNEFPLYGRAMLIKGFVDRDIWSSEVDTAIITSVVLYNKGLLYHVLGQGSATMLAREPYIMRASILYEKALSLINTCSASPRDYFWLKSLLLNNLGQIRSYMCDRAGEQACLWSMKELLLHRFERDEIAGEEDLKLNVMLLSGVHRPSPAA